jgi:hypothetical protein
MAGGSAFGGSVAAWRVAVAAGWRLLWTVDCGLQIRQFVDKMIKQPPTTESAPNPAAR